MGGTLGIVVHSEKSQAINKMKYSPQKTVAQFSLSKTSLKSRRGHGGHQTPLPGEGASLQADLKHIPRLPGAGSKPRALPQVPVTVTLKVHVIILSLASSSAGFQTNSRSRARTRSSPVRGHMAWFPKPMKEPRTTVHLAVPGQSPLGQACAAPNRVPEG